MRTPPIAALLLLGIAFCGCQRNLYFGTGTQFGLELNALEGGCQTVKLGFQRVEGVVMPLRRTAEDDANAPGQIKEAYPVLSIYDMDTGSLGFGALAGRVKTVR